MTTYPELVKAVRTVHRVAAEWLLGEATDAEMAEACATVALLMPRRGN